MVNDVLGLNSFDRNYTRCILVENRVLEEVAATTRVRLKSKAGTLGAAGALSLDWFVKTGLYAADETRVQLRADIFRKKLWNIV